MGGQQSLADYRNFSDAIKKGSHSLSGKISLSF